MNDVLNKIYGDLVAEEEYRMPKGVPVYISQGYEYRQLAFEDQRCLLAKPKGNDWNIAGLKKQANQIEECLGQKVVLDLYRLSAHQRENLIRSGIAFISGTGQLFIPFWGSYFEARITNPHEKREQMTDNAQLVFLTLYYSEMEKKSGMTQTTIAKKAAISKSSCTRAIQILSGMGLVEIVSVGTENRVSLKGSLESVLQTALPHMSSPVKKLIYAKQLPQGIQAKKSGIMALADHTMLSRLPSDEGYAISRDREKSIPCDLLIDLPDFRDCGGVIIEVWRYDPKLLSDSDRVDEISLLLALDGDEDERVQNELDRIREKHKIERSL